MTAIVTIAIGGSFGYKVYANIQSQKQVEQMQLLVNKHTTSINKLQIESQSLYSNENIDFLNENVSKRTVTL